MGYLVCGGAGLACSFGIAPSVLNVLPAARVMSGTALASIMDQVPMVNILPFGMCTHMANPTVAAATAAALGVLTPMPCIPVTTSPWSATGSKIMIGGKPALDNRARLMCNWGGTITIIDPGQHRILT